MIDASLASDNPLRIRKDILQIIKKIIMTIDDKIRDEKLQYDINRKAAKISALSTAKLTNMIVLQVKKYRFLIKEEKQLKIKKKIKSTWRAWKTTDWI